MRTASEILRDVGSSTWKGGTFASARILLARALFAAEADKCMRALAASVTTVSNRERFVASFPLWSDCAHWVVLQHKVKSSLTKTETETWAYLDRQRPRYADEMSRVSGVEGLRHVTEAGSLQLC